MFFRIAVPRDKLLTEAFESIVLARRYHASFKDPLLAAAGIDRLCHRAEIIIIRGESFRAQTRQRLEQEGTIN